MEDTDKEPMTYRQIKEYSDGQGWDFSAGAFEGDLMKRGYAPSADGNEPFAFPWGVDRWLDHEVTPAIRKTGRYEWPDDLDIRCEFTVLQTGRYVTDPVDETRLHAYARGSAKPYR